MLKKKNAKFLNKETKKIKKKKSRSGPKKYEKIYQRNGTPRSSFKFPLNKKPTHKQNTEKKKNYTKQLTQM